MAVWLRAAGLVAVLAAMLPTVAMAATMIYDPNGCAKDAEGMVYLAFERIVIRLPAEELTLLGDLPPQRLAEAPQPPDADEAEGCPDHPIQAGSFTFSYLYEAIRKDRQSPKLPPYAPSKLALIAVRPDFWGLQPMAEQRYQETCEKFGEQGEIGIGLTACWHASSNDATPREAWAVVLMARPEIYTAPFGRPFVVDCYPRLSAGTQDCRVTYKLYETLNVSYEVRVQSRYSDRFVPLSEIIEFDRGLRSKIEAARVHGYRWPSE